MAEKSTPLPLTQKGLANYIGTGLLDLIEEGLGSISKIGFFDFGSLGTGLFPSSQKASWSHKSFSCFYESSYIQYLLHFEC